MSAVISLAKKSDTAKELAEFLGVQCFQVDKIIYSDSEFKFKNIPEIADQEIYVCATTEMPVNNLLDTYFLLKELKDRNPKRLVLIVTYLAFNRQDKRDAPDESSLSSKVIDLLSETGVSEVFVVNSHDKKTRDKFANNNVVIHEINLLPFLLGKALHEIKGEVTLVAPDKGSALVVQQCAELYGLPYLEFKKKRVQGVATHEFPSNFEKLVKGKNIILIDDMIDTAGTIISLANLIYENEVASIHVIATHPILSGLAAIKIYESAIKKIYVSNSIHISNETVEILNSKLHTYSLSEAVKEYLVQKI